MATPLLILLENLIKTRDVYTKTTKSIDVENFTILFQQIQLLLTTERLLVWILIYSIFVLNI